MQWVGKFLVVELVSEEGKVECSTWTQLSLLLETLDDEDALDLVWGCWARFHEWWDPLDDCDNPLAVSGLETGLAMECWTFWMMESMKGGAGIGGKMLQFSFSFATSFLFRLTPLVATGEDSAPRTILTLLSWDLRPSSYLTSSSLIFGLSSPPPVLSHRSVFPTSTLFYYLPSVSFLSEVPWSVRAGPQYINYLFTICILYS